MPSRSTQTHKRRALEAVAVLSLVACSVVLLRPDGESIGDASASPTPAASASPDRTTSSSASSWLRGGFVKRANEREMVRLNEHLKLNSRDAEALFERSLLHRLAGDKEAELADLNGCIENKKSAMGVAYGHRARILAEQGRYHDAEDDLLDSLKALGGDNGGTQAYVHIGRGQYEEALTQTRIILTFSPKNLEALYIKAVALSYLEREDEADEAFDAVYKIDPDYELTWIACVECKAKNSKSASNSAK